MWTIKKETLIAICDNIRTKLGLTNKYSSADIPECINKVFEAGKLALLKDSEYMNATESGTVIAVNDVSPIEHKLNVNLSSDTITDFSSVKVTQRGKNQVVYPYYERSKTANGITFTAKSDGSITANGTATALTDFNVFFNTNTIFLKKGENLTLSGSKGGANSTYRLMAIVRLADGTEQYVSQYSAAKVLSFDQDVTITRLTFRIASGTAMNEVVVRPQIEYGTVATPFELFKSKTVTANADGTVEGLTSISPSMTLLTNNSNASITCQYYRDIDLYINNLITNVALTGGE